MNNVINRVAQAQESLAFFNSAFFKRVQCSGLFADSKTFADAIVKTSFNDILTSYERIKDEEHFNLTSFIKENFELPIVKEVVSNGVHSDINQQITSLWRTLTKPQDKALSSSLLPLKHPYIVPGGRFREIYYWDSYFTALGLIESNQLELAEAMLANFVELQTNYQCIPNGNRSYYLSRSQPPILGLLVELLLPHQKNKTVFLSQYITAIEAEYHFWMKGSDNLADNNNENKRVVKMPDGSMLNRYWDDNASPRPESYREDIELFESQQNTDAELFYRNIRAACESGWDFSSRWLEGEELSSICTTRVIPIDLNCLLYKQEMLLARFYSEINKGNNAANYFDKAKLRRNAIDKYLWSAHEKFYMDYHIDKQCHTKIKSLAGVLPLFVELTTALQAKNIAEYIEKDFLKLGGLVTTLVESGQQWDAPNGWAPLHWFTVQGLKAYQYDELALTITQRWQSTIQKYFSHTGKLMEKYNVCQQSEKAGGGEYDVQEGFGWTNGVYQAFNSHT